MNDAAAVAKESHKYDTRPAAIPGNGDGNRRGDKTVQNEYERKEPF